MKKYFLLFIFLAMLLQGCQKEAEVAKQPEPAPVAESEQDQITMAMFNYGFSSERAYEQREDATRAGDLAKQKREAEISDLYKKNNKYTSHELGVHNN